jgi:hypothetical protein
MTWRLTVIPGDYLPILDMGVLDRFGQAIVVDKLGLAVLADQEIAAVVGSEAKGIDVEIGQIHQVKRISQPEMIAIRFGVEPLPEPLPPLPTPFRAEHGCLSCQGRKEKGKSSKEKVKR